ncbi:acyl-CoA carboxylase subunit epsilon [Streptomyces sp. RPT161]|uniref:acyl-CoA carboxylase subunit epsilon n=1 Tax=Streptomyces sp. RPT161 TaxID=3015993 RepID=UPI0022B87D9D|nr:acyl-CoA carboxylase subunit epsilon [Streptomyces sp. RPT161]
MTGQDPQALRVLRGNPMPEEVAVLTLALLAVSRQAAQCAGNQTDARPRWPRGADPVPAAGQWAGGARPGWCSH